jgi:hypothetical protein
VARQVTARSQQDHRGEARKLQPWARQTAIDEVAALRKVWTEQRGGEIVTLPPAEQAELEKRLRRSASKSPRTIRR